MIIITFNFGIRLNQIKAFDRTKFRGGSQYTEQSSSNIFTYLCFRLSKYVKKLKRKALKVNSKQYVTAKPTRRICSVISTSEQTLKYH